MSRGYLLFEWMSRWSSRIHWKSFSSAIDNKLLYWNDCLFIRPNIYIWSYKAGNISILYIHVYTVCSSQPWYISFFKPRPWCTCACYRHIFSAFFRDQTKIQIKFIKTVKTIVSQSSKISSSKSKVSGL